MGIEINTGYSCYLSAARRRRGRFFLLLDLGPGAAAGGMGLELTLGTVAIYLIVGGFNVFFMGTN